MSQGNVELVRRIYEDGWMDRDPDRLLALADPEIEHVNPPDAVEPGTRRGLADVERAVRSPQQTFEYARHELHQVFGSGDTVVAAVEFIARSRGSTAEIVQAEAHTWTFRNGRILRFEWGRDLRAALEAAGLSE